MDKNCLREKAIEYFNILALTGRTLFNPSDYTHDELQRMGKIWLDKNKSYKLSHVHELIDGFGDPEIPTEMSSLSIDEVTNILSNIAPTDSYGNKIKFEILINPWTMSISYHCGGLEVQHRVYMMLNKTPQIQIIEPLLEQ